VGIKFQLFVDLGLLSRSEGGSGGQEKLVLCRGGGQKFRGLTDARLRWGRCWKKEGRARQWI